MSSSSGRPVNPSIAGPEQGHVFVQSYGIFAASTTKFHQDRGHTVYDFRGRVIPSAGPPPYPLPILGLRSTQSYMIFVPGHGIYRGQTAAQHLALGRYVFDHTGLPLRPVPAQRLINNRTRTARDNRDESKEPGRGMRPLGDHLDVDQASRAVEDQWKAENDRRIDQARAKDAEDYLTPLRKDDDEDSGAAGAAGVS